MKAVVRLPGVPRKPAFGLLGLEFRQLVRPPTLRAEVQDGEMMALAQVDVRPPRMRAMS